MIRADFHLHSEYSFDSRTSLNELIERAVEVDLNCLALTDHNTIEGALALAEIAPFQVIVGEEISSAEGHIIGLFLHDEIAPGQSVEDTIAHIHEQGGIAVAPHPFARLAGASLQKAFLRHASLFDAVEVANSNNLLWFDDAKAAQFSATALIPAIGGSDAHLPCGIGSCIVEMPYFHGASDFLSCLRYARIQSRLHPARYFAEVGMYDLNDRLRTRIGLPPYVRSPLLQSRAMNPGNAGTPTLSTNNS